MASQDPQSFHWHYTELDDHNFEIRGRTLLFVIVLVATILLVTLILLYACWIFRFNYLNSSAAPSPLAVPHAPPSRPQGLDPAVINGLPIILHGSGSGEPEEKECCICLGVFEDGEKVKVLPRCKHRYHCECVDRWLSSHSSCPLCRVSIRVESDVLQIVTG